MPAWCSLGCGKQAQGRCRTAAGENFCSKACLKAAGKVAGQLSLSYGCFKGCGKPSQSRWQDGDKRRFCSKTCLESFGAQLSLPEGQTCFNAGCNEPVQYRCTADTGARFCSNACLNAFGAVLVVPESTRCSKPGCFNPGCHRWQGEGEGEGKRRFCSKTCLQEFGAELALAESAKCTACPNPKQSRWQDQFHRQYCSKECVEASGVELVVPESARCAKTGCQLPGQHRCQDLEGKRYCCDEHLPQSCIDARLAAVLERYGMSDTREIVMSDTVREAGTAFVLSQPFVAAHFRPGYAVHFMALSVSMHTQPMEVLECCLVELDSILRRAEAVAKTAAGAAFGVSDRRAMDVKMDVLCIGRVGNTTGRAGHEGKAQKRFSHLPLGSRLWTGVSGSGAKLGPDLAQLTVIVSLRLPADARIKPLTEHYHIEAERWKAELAAMPSMQELAARYLALDAQHAGRLTWLNKTGLTLDAGWSAFLDGEAAWNAAHAAALAPRAAPASCAQWDGDLSNAALLLTGWRATSVEISQLRRHGASLAASDKHKFEVLVYAPSGLHSAKYIAAERVGVPLVTKVELLRRLAELDGAAGAANWTDGGGGGGGGGGRQNRDLNEHGHVKRKRLAWVLLGEDDNEK